MRTFIGVVNYYRDIWARHLLHPSTALSSNKVKLKWTYVEQKAFDDIKHDVDQNTLLAYTDFKKCFDIHTDDSNYQLGAVISQDGKPIAFCMHKLTGPQM